MEAKRNIVLVDDHVIIRKGLKELISKLGPYEVADEYNTGKELLQAYPLKSNPDLIILDVSMPGMNGDVVMQELNKLGNKIPVLILTLNRDETTIIKLFRSGVRGYLEKNCTAVVFKTALDEIFRCGYYHNEFFDLSVQNLATNIEKTEQQRILDRLSLREKEFLKFVCDEKEYTYEQIADLMAVQHRTVDGYRQSIFGKFAIKSKTGLVLFVLKYNLLPSL